MRRFYRCLTDGTSTHVQLLDHNDDLSVNNNWRNVDVGQVTSIHCDRDTGSILFGKADGQAGVWSDDDLEITNQKMEADTSVTAFIAGYIAHGRIVSKLSPPVFDEQEDRYSENRSFERRTAVRANEPVTLMHKYNRTLLCFAGNVLYQYDSSTLERLFNMDRIGLALEIGNTNRGPVLCFALNKYVIYATGIYKLTDYDNKFNNVISVLQTMNLGCVCQRVRLASILQSCMIIADCQSLETIDDFLEPVATVDPNRLPLGNLCAPHTMVISLLLFLRIRYKSFPCVDRTDSSSSGDGDSSSSHGPHIISSSSEEDSSSDEGPVVDEPSSAAGGRGSKRRQTLDESDPAFERKRLAFLRQAFQHLTKEERAAIMAAPRETMEKLYEEECMVCMEPLRKKMFLPSHQRMRAYNL